MNEGLIDGVQPHAVHCNRGDTSLAGLPGKLARAFYRGSKRRFKQIMRWGMKGMRGISRRSIVVFVTLAVVIVAVVVGVLLAKGETESQLFLIAFHESVDRVLVEEYGGEVWTVYRSRVYAWMTPGAAEALGEHEAVAWVDQRELFLITFRESIDAALVEEYGGEIWTMYPLASRINAWMTAEAAEALAEHEAVECVDQRQLFAIMFEEEADPALVEEYGGEIFYQMSMLPAVDAFMTPEAAEALGEHPAVRFVEPDWPLEPPWPVQPVELPED